MTVEFKLKGAAELDEMLRQLPRQARRLGRNAVLAGARVIAADARRRVPRKTGDLRKAIKAVAVRRVSDPRSVEAAVGVGGRESGLAHLVEFGSAAHPIEPKRGKALLLDRTVIADGRVTQFVARVDHPGAARQPFLRPAGDTKARAALERIGENLGRGIERELEKQARRRR